MPHPVRLRPQKENSPKLCLLPKTPSTFISDSKGTLPRVFGADGEIYRFPHRYSVERLWGWDLLTAQKWYWVALSLCYQNNCTGLLSRTGHRDGKHVVGKHLPWQSKDELTHLLPPLLILDGILRVTEKNTLAKNGDNSARGRGGGYAHRALLGKPLKYHLIILLHTPLLPPWKMPGGWEDMSSRAFHSSTIFPSYPIWNF